MSTPSLFDYINDISFKKDYLFEEDDRKNYNQFMINRGLAQHVDTLMFANEMNKRSQLNDEMHHDFLFYSISSKKRYGKWVKADTTDTDLVAFLQDKYAINQETAMLYLKLSDKNEIKQLKKESEKKGGKA